MRIVFADTSWFLALLIDNDKHHSTAVEISRSLHGRIMTSEYVLVEVINHLSPPEARSRVRSFIEAIENDQYTAVVPASSELLHRGIELFLERPDKGWSLTDCISFVLMQENRVTEALTTDHHFEQAGFVALLGQ